MPSLIPVVQMIGVRRVKIDGPLYKTQSQYTGVKVEIVLRDRSRSL
jgi:hypothetical protein